MPILPPGQEGRSGLGSDQASLRIRQRSSVATGQVGGAVCVAFLVDAELDKRLRGVARKTDRSTQRRLGQFDDVALYARFRQGNGRGQAGYAAADDQCV